MLIQTRKYYNNLSHFSQFYQGYITFFIYFQGKSGIQLFVFRKSNSQVDMKLLKKAIL